MKNDVVIIGYGIVGQNLEKEISVLNPDVIDKYKDKTCECEKHNVGFICVDTPILENKDVDVSEVKNAILENDCDIYVIKSTCPIGTVDKLKKETGKRIVFSPEYYGGTLNNNFQNNKFDFTILGGEDKDCVEVVQMLQHCYTGRHQFRIIDSKSAEIAKFMENSFLATKVSFCNSFYNLCKDENVDYEKVRELFILDERINPSHTFVYKETPYWDTHCLNKDVNCIAYTKDMELLKSVCEFNEKQKTKNDKYWEDKLNSLK